MEQHEEPDDHLEPQGVHLCTHIHTEYITGVISFYNLKPWNNMVNFQNVRLDSFQRSRIRLCLVWHKY